MKLYFNGSIAWGSFWSIASATCFGVIYNPARIGVVLLIIAIGIAIAVDTFKTYGQLIAQRRENERRAKMLASIPAIVLSLLLLLAIVTGVYVGLFS